MVFPRPPSDEFSTKWQLTCQKDMAQVIVMQHVTYPALDRFAAELAAQLGRPPLEGFVLDEDAQQKLLMPEWAGAVDEPALV